MMACIKNIIKKIVKILLKFALSVFVIILLLFCAYIGWWEWQMYKPLMTKKFDSKEWKLAKEKVWRSEFKLNGKVIQSDLDVALERRCGMYHDLTRNHLKKGMTIKEIEELLGPIDHWYYYKSDKQKCTGHHMGICYSNALTMVPMSLFTCFNKQGKLISYDRDDHDNDDIGTYYPKTKKQSCWRSNENGTRSEYYDCGINPW